MTRRGESGGALLEVALAIALTALLAAALTQATRFGLTVIERAGAAEAGAAADYRARREIAARLARLDHAGPDRPVFRGDAREMTWRGVAQAPDGGWRAGIWRLNRGDRDEAAILSACAGFAADATCEEAARFPPLGRFAYVADDGETFAAWPEGGAPAVILAGEDGALAVQPRVAGARR